MPVDYKRINGPEESTPYQLYVKKELSWNPESEKRTDGRTSLELRKVYLKTNVVSQAKGSAYIEVGNTKVIVSVFDPREIPNKNEYSLNGDLFCEFKFAPFSCPKRKGHQLDDQEKEYSVILRRALESTVCRHEFPNFQVDIFALVIQNDGSALSAAISCAGLALAQAGVPMYDLISCVTIAKRDNVILVDPTYEEEELCSSNWDQQVITYNELKRFKQNILLGPDPKIDNLSNAKDAEEKYPKLEKYEAEHGVLIASMLQTHEQITEFSQMGCMSLETLEDLFKISITKNAEFIPLLQNYLVDYIKHKLDENEEE